MAHYFLCMCLLRVALPICLTLSIIFRPSVLSAMYLLLLLYLPIVPIPTSSTMSGHTGCYLKMVICISFLTAISQLTFQIVLLSIPPYAYFLKDCEFLERILRHVGFIRLDGLSAKDVVQWLSPEIVMLFSSILVYVLCAKLSVKRFETNPDGMTEEGTNESVTVVVLDSKPKKEKKFGFLIVLGRYIALGSLCIAGCLRPSIPNAFYFLIFLGAATWWSCYKELRKAFAYVCRITLVVLFFHISALYAYQFQWPQEYLHPNSTYARYFGLTPIMSVNCDDDPRSIIFNDIEWASYLNPIWLLWLYYILSIESKLLLLPQTQKKSGTFSRLDGSYNGPLRRQLSNRLSNKRLVRSGTTHHRWQTATRKVRVSKDASLPSERTPLIRGVSPSRKYGAGQSKATVLQDSTGSVTIAGDGQDDIPMQQLGKETAEEDLQPTLFENIVFALASIFQVLVRSSYIATNIIMMAWSITYHCWLTFVLLLWANLLWLLPNQRRAMLRSAPFLVIYAEFLLLSAYVYGMNLTEDELPSKIQDINLAQIGFEKILVLPCKSLIVKCLYTTMFWITLRQYMHERQEARQSSALADMVAPLEVTVGTATSAMTKEQESKGSQIMKTLGEYLKKFLTKFWIWIVAINLFVVAITGDRMTGFRIIYMFLFLLFILTFQLSYRIWRKIMYGFWVTVIGYSMLTLVLVYTYQFDNFPNYWTNYLHIPPEQQLDIGLERYETKQLFVRLLTPTFFVVITVIQLHYFHKDFLEITQITPPNSNNTNAANTTTTSSANETRPRLESDPRSDDSSAQGGPWDPESEKTDTITTERPRVSIKSLKDKNRLLLLLKYVWRKIQKAMAYLWLYLEIHMFKIVLLIAMLLTVYDTCAIHFAIMLLSVIAVTLGKKAQTVAIHLCSTIVSVMLLARMVYQIKYIDHSKWDVHCDNTTATIVNTTVYNNAEWLGFRKMDRGRDLPSLVKWYIGFILVVTIRAIILIRQEIWRINNNKPRERPYFLFPKITRADADKNVKKCLMYLTNYGFYKFGVEVCFMATVALIGTRMDFYACLYGFWLCAMCMMSREKLSRVWIFYLAFIAFVLPLQYFMVVGLPPGLCIVFPWDIEGEDWRLRHMQDWMFLLDIKYPPQAHKLICDIFLLILVARQSVIFRIERRYENSETQYRGGSNKSIIHLAEDPTFVNPVPDFITYIRTWLDIFKRGILLSFMWITLAIVFLAGTNRVNFFSLGYLVGSFIFLWQGSDLYLRPIPRILKAWNWLLGYNVAVIMVKSLLQIWGCIFFDDVNACWLMKLLGIGCIQKFGLSPLLPGSATPTQCPPVPREDIGLAWDGLCFGFLIMQRRIFNSFNFFHVIDETKATTILASRGAELMEELREKQMSQQGEQERKILEKIKHKMDRIKATQQKIQGPHYKDASNHFVEQAPIARSPSLSSVTSTTSATSATSDHTAEAGYHTPIDEEDEECDEADGDGDDEAELEDDPPPLTPRTGSLLQTQAPTPCSALMTVSLEGYLEPKRMSFGSPPNSDLNPRPPSDDESFPVFSPPPYDAAVGGVSIGDDKDTTTVIASRSVMRADDRQTAASSIGIGPPWMQGSFVTPRQSIISYSSRSPQSHHTYSIFPKSSRPLQPTKVATSYKEAIRSGDYYMFDDLDDEELDLITEKDDDETEDDLVPKSKSKTVGEYLSTAMKSGSKRRASMPLARQRSTVSTRSHLSAPLPVLSSKSDKGSPRRGPVRIQEEGAEDEPVPGSSKQHPRQDDDDEMSLLSDILPAEDTKGRKVLNVILFLWGFVESLMNTATNYLNRFSRDFRYVLRVLSKEKKLLKEHSNFRHGTRRVSTELWEPKGSFHSLVKQMSNSDSDEDTTASVGSLTPTDSYRRTLSMNMALALAARSRDEHDTHDTDYDHQPSSLDPIIPHRDAELEDFRRKASVLTVPEIRILAPSMERGLDSPMHSSHVPIDIMVDYETAEMSSLDQPAIIRLMHAIWFAILSHSDFVCYVMIFLNQIKSASVLSLPLPLMVFLWGTLTIPRPSKTFWITIIAYTEVIVLIKCIFQFQILEDTPQVNNPFHPPRILGIERTSNYATYDLLLLLIVFFHRLMLKTLGLWKSSYEPQECLSEGIYKVNSDDEEDEDTLTSKSKKSKKSRQVRIMIVIQNESHSNETVNRIFNDKRESRIKKNLQKSQYLNNEEIVKTILSDLIHNIKQQQENKYKLNILDVANLTLVKEKRKGSEITEQERENEDLSNKSLVRLSTEEISPLSAMPKTIKLATKKYINTVKEFFEQLLDPTSRITVDVYAYMFMCDFINFMVVIFGFAAFGTQQGDGGVSAYLQENKVPIPFLLMLILQFVLIIVDRGLFLRKYILGKIIFQFLQIIGVHIWMFFVLPAVTERSFNALLPPKIWYMVKCFYLLLSAYQIRCGYPTRILGNFLCKGYNYVNMILFKLFMSIPFLFELRTIMDWMWTDTSMTIFDWLKMEDIFATIFQLKCSRHVETEYPQPRGEKKKVLIKYLMGGAGLFAIIAVIWFPLVFFALGSTVGDANIPYDVTLNLRIGPYQPVYSMSAQTNAIFRFTEADYSILTNNYKKDRVALTFLSSYEHDDVAAIQLNGNSTMVWGISPPDLDRMVEEVKSDNDIVLRLRYIISRVSNNKQESGIITSESSFTMPAMINSKPNPDRVNLALMLQDTEQVKPILIQRIFPKFVKVTNRAIATPVTQLLNADYDDEHNSMRNITLKLSRAAANQNQTAQMWWELKEDCSDVNYKTIKNIPRSNCEYLVMYTFNEKSFPASLSFLSGGGIIGLYTTLVFVASRMIRGIFSEICFKIMFDDLPYVDRVLQLCLDIYLVREARELCLEEDLFAKLVFLFRSPETLIKWTRPKEDDENDDPEADEDDVDDNNRQHQQQAIAQ